MAYVPIAIQTLILISATVGLGLTIRTLRAHHDWNRRHFAAKMIEDWNPRTSAHRQAIERLKPGLIDLIRGSDKVQEINKAEAKEIYRSTPNSPELWELRFHFIELLNYFEFIATCFLNNVSDQHMIEESFKNVYMSWYKVLANFIDEFAEARGYSQDNPPWGPYHALVEKWRTELQPPPRPIRKKTGI